MRNIFFYVLLLISKFIHSQEQRLLSYDLITGNIDTINIQNFDTTILHDHTDYCTGKLNDYYNNLNDTPPYENVYPDSRFSTKRQASLDYDINKFPIRTSMKLFKWENDSIKSKCSGSMVSRKHVLTACHCVAKINTDSLLYDSLFVCPVIDNGEYNPNFDCNWVKKIFFFENWNMSNTDFAVLELENPVGENTGWISIGFDSNDNSLLDGVFYKFSYPAATILSVDSNSYNGDTLYYGYGIADIANEHIFGVSNASGIPGESGSSLIKIENEKTYTSYGVYSYSLNLKHSRLINWKYYAIKSIIIEDIELNTTDTNIIDFVSVYPNPTSDYVNIICQDNHKASRIILYDINGNKLIEKNYSAGEIYLDLSYLPAGFYILIIDTENKKTIKKVIKYGS